MNVLASPSAGVKASLKRTDGEAITMRRAQAVLIGVLGLTLFASSLVSSTPYGIGEVANDGCLCHTMESPVDVTLAGLPDAYEANTTYNLTLSVTSSVPSVDGESKGGFRLLASNGTLSGDDQLVHAMEGGWTHTTNGSEWRTWSLTWQSPVDNSSRTEFIVHGNAVNGNNATSGDAWSTLEVVIPGVNYQGDLIPNEGINGLDSNDRILLVVALLVMVGLLWTSARP